MNNIPDTDGLQSVGAEMRLLGSILVDPWAFKPVSVYLKSGDFFLLRHQHIYAAMERMTARGDELDLDLLSYELEAVKHLEAIGGRAYIAELSASVATAYHAEKYAEIIKRKAIRRELMRYADEVKNLVMNSTLDVETVLVKAEAEFKAISLAPATRQTSISLDLMLEQYNDLIDEAATKSPDARRCTPRLSEITRFVPEYEPGGVVLIAARPKTGKSSYGWAEMLHIARTYGPVQGYSLEMSERQLSTTLLSTIGGIPATALWTKRLSQQQYKAMLDARSELHNTPLHVDTKLRYIEDIRNDVMSKPGLAAIFIDGGNLVRTKARGKDKTYEVATHISRELQNLAKESGVIVFCAMQINRSGADRPTLETLKDTGAWEEDASLVLALHREEMVDTVDLDTMLETEAIILASRDGASGTAMLGWRPAYRSYVSLATDRQKQSRVTHNGRREARPRE